MLKEMLIAILPLGVPAMFNSPACSAELYLARDGCLVRVAQAKKKEDDPIKELSELLNRKEESDRLYARVPGRKSQYLKEIGPPVRDNVRIKERAIRQFDDQQRLEAERRLLELR